MHHWVGLVLAPSGGNRGHAIAYWLMPPGFPVDDEAAVAEQTRRLERVFERAAPGRGK